MQGAGTVGRVEEQHELMDALGPDVVLTDAQLRDTISHGTTSTNAGLLVIAGMGSSECVVLPHEGLGFLCPWSVAWAPEP